MENPVTSPFARYYLYYIDAYINEVKRGEPFTDKDLFRNVQSLMYHV